MRKIVNRENRLIINNTMYNSNNTGTYRSQNTNINHIFNQSGKMKLEAELNKKNDIIKTLKKEIGKLKYENSQFQKSYHILYYLLLYFLNLLKMFHYLFFCC